MAQQFFDNLNDGTFDAWTETVTAGTGAVSNPSTYLQASADSSGSENARGLARKDITWPATNQQWLQFKFKWTSWTRSGFNIAGSHALGGWFDAENQYGDSGSHQPVFWLAVVGERTLRAAYRQTSDDAATFAGAGTQQFTLNQEYTIKMLLDTSGANPEVTWWVDESEIGSATDSSGGTGGLSRTKNAGAAGICVSINQEPTGYTLQVDDFGVYSTDPDAGAINSRNKRMSLICLALPMRVLPNPDGSISAPDRLQLNYLYSGIAASGTPVANESELFLLWRRRR